MAPSQKTATVAMISHVSASQPHHGIRVPPPFAHPRHSRTPAGEPSSAGLLRATSLCVDRRDQQLRRNDRVNAPSGLRRRVPGFASPTPRLDDEFDHLE
jgi:hypothetical protein